MAKEISVIVRAIDAVTGPIREMNSRIKGFVDGIRSVFSGLAALGISISIGKLFKDAVEGAIESEASIDRLNTALQTLGLSYPQVSSEVEKYLNTLQRTTRFSDEDGREALVNLIGVTQDYRKSVELLSLTADVAAKRHISMADAAVVVGKASLGLAKGLGDLGIKTGETGDLITKLRQNVGGFAESEGKTFGGRVQILSNLWNEFKEQVGLAIIGNDRLKNSMGDLATALVNAAKYVAEHSAEISKYVSGIITLARWTGELAGKLLSQIPQWGLVTTAVKLAGKAHEDAAKQVVAGELESTKAVAAGTSTRRNLTAAELLAIQTITDDGYDKLTAAQRATLAKLATTQKLHSNTMVTLGTDQIKAIQKFTDEGHKAEEKSAADSHKALAELQKLANKAQLQLLTAQEKEYEELTRTFQEKMQVMDAADKAKALRLLDEAHKNLLLKWAGFQTNVEIATAKISQTTTTNLEIIPPVVEDLNAVLTRLGLKLTDAQQKALAAGVAHRKLRDDMDDVGQAISDAAQKMAGFLDVLGLSDDKTQKLVQGIGELGDAISAMAHGDIGTAIIKGIGGIKDVIAGIFGKSEAEKQLIAGLAKNRDSLEKLSRNIGDLNINLTGKQLAGSQAALKEFFAGGGATTGLGWGEKLGGLLLKQGLTMDDLDAVAKTLEINLRPSGHLDPQALNQLMQALGLIEPTQFGTDFKGQREQLRHETTLFNLTPEEQATRLAGIGAGQTTGSVADILGTLDFSTAAGRNQAMASLQDLFAGFTSGQVPVGEIGGLTPGDFLAFLEDLKSLIETANENAANATTTTEGSTPTVLPEPSAGTPAPEPSVGSSAGAVDLGTPTGLGTIPSGADLLSGIRNSVGSMDLNIGRLVPGLVIPEGALATALASLSKAPAAPITIDAKMTGDLVLNFGSEDALPTSDIATAVARAVEQRQEEQLKVIDQLLGQYFLKTQQIRSGTVLSS
jgi:hypothetical protein